MENDLYIGSQYMTQEGRSIKHPGLIVRYGNPTIRKISEDPMDFVSLDIETDKDTGELKLLGRYNGKQYKKTYKEGFFSTFFAILRYCKHEERRVVYWNKLDPFILLKMFLQELPDDVARRESMQRFGKVDGHWNKKAGEWDVHPVVEIKRGGYSIGIKNSIRSSVQFFYYEDADPKLHTIWAYDIAQFYKGGIEKNAKDRLDYYSKVSERAHLVDWDQYETDKEYREEVLHSNELDARAAYDLAHLLQEDFKRAFGYYPKTMISAGSLARAGIVAVTRNRLMDVHVEEKELDKAVRNEINAIGIMNYYDEWADRFGKDFLKDLYCLMTEAYSGGWIEAFCYGHAKEGWYIDLANAYPGEAQHLKDLRGADIKYGTGEPPDIDPENDYCLIRGFVDIPRGVEYHSLTIKHFDYVNKDTNIRATGQYRASYYKEERDFLISKGAKFKDEEWYWIKTKGELSPLAYAVLEFVKLRKELNAKGDSAELRAKDGANSIYGTLFEAVDTHEEREVEKEIVVDEYREENYRHLLRPYYKNIDMTNVYSDLNPLKARWHNKNGQTPDVVAQELIENGVQINADNESDIMEVLDTLWEHDSSEKLKKKITLTEVFRVGYRAGEFWNPFYAGVITARARVKMAKAADHIRTNGGKPIIAMTDSLTFTGDKSMVPPELVREVKTLGYFEPPEKVYDITCLGSGRYGFRTFNEKTGKYDLYKSKRRGLNASDIHDANGISIGSFDWHKALQVMVDTGEDKMNIKTKTLVSPGLVLNNHKYTWKDLGRIVEDERKVDAIVGKTKRYIAPGVKNPEKLMTELIDTQALHLDPYMFGRNEPHDQTLPQLRKLTMAQMLMTQKERKADRSKKTSKRYYDKHRPTIAKNFKTKYALLKAAGYDRDDATRMANWSDARLEMEGIL